MRIYGQTKLNVASAINASDIAVYLTDFSESLNTATIAEQRWTRRTVNERMLPMPEQASEMPQRVREVHSGEYSECNHPRKTARNETARQLQT